MAVLLLIGREVKRHSRPPHENKSMGTNCLESFPFLHVYIRKAPRSITTILFTNTKTQEDKNVHSDACVL